MPMDMRPKVVYNAVTLLFTFYQRPWDYTSTGDGGYDKSGAGIPAAYELLRNQLAIVRPRFYENEWPSVATWIEWAQRYAHIPFTWQFDQADAATAYSVYLDAPKMGDDIKPRRTEYLDVFDIELTLRTSNGVRFYQRGFVGAVNVPVASIDVQPNTVTITH